MNMAVQPYSYNAVSFDGSPIEQLILSLGDIFNIRIVWDQQSALLTGALVLAGGVVGGLAGGRLGAAVGAGIGSVTGIGAATALALREVWTDIKEKVKELFFIVFNYLRRLDPVDYVNAIQIVMSCTGTRTELVLTILDFIAHKLGKEVLSSLTAA
ncbi:uncharacterized protein LOC105386396 [Plutella xylostella]|uniref:uncharacterized protein LOC105386396 n=1 Tax=Plutella xylostella TaxID=51655 RepID=UPI00203252FE|nr:uncharacterized protein LOC105386396 [Plutella xylostella]